MTGTTTTELPAATRDSPTVARILPAAVRPARETQADPETAPRPPAGLLQRACTCGGTPGPDGECAECRAKRRPASGSAAAKSGIGAPSDIVSQVDRARGSGRPLAPALRSAAGRALGADLNGVRVHTGGESDRLNRSLGARAFTSDGDVFFRNGAYDPGSRDGSRLLAHELAHVVQQRASRADTVRPMVNTPGDAFERAAESASRAAAPRLARAAGASVSAPEEDVATRPVGGVGAPFIQRDLAVAPTTPDAAEPVLTEAQITAAVAYNAFRFKDPFTISFVREVVGVERYPAVSDRDLALAVARYQASYGLTPDGQVGPATTRALVRELGAEDQRRFARLLREDNFVSWVDVNPQLLDGCGQFQWDVNWRTTLREGWLIQRIDNTWHATNCAGGADATPAITHQYWEAWWIDANGRAWIPTSLGTPPTIATPATADDLWRRPTLAATRGDWSMTGHMYTTLTLPAGFAIRGVPEALDLPATVGPVAEDDLGLLAGYRRIGGRWDCCDADATRHFHRRA